MVGDQPRQNVHEITPISGGVYLSSGFVGDINRIVVQASPGINTELISKITKV
jgi:hypothetical protein